MDLFLPRRMLPLVGATAMAATSVVYNAYRQHKQFYPSMVSLASSNMNMLVRVRRRPREKREERGREKTAKECGRHTEKERQRDGKADRLCSGAPTRQRGCVREMRRRGRERE